jgi:hypothetical protein
MAAAGCFMQKSQINFSFFANVNERIANTARESIIQ